MRPHNSPSSRTTNVYKSSAMIKKVSPQQRVLSGNMIQSRKKLGSARSQESLGSASDRGQRSQDSTSINVRNKKLPAQRHKENPNVVRSNQRTKTQVDYGNYSSQQNSQRAFNTSGMYTSNRNSNNKIQEKAHTFDNQDQYIGEWSYDQKELRQKPQGYGCYKFKAQRLQYRGQFKQGLMHGTGTLHRLLGKGKPEVLYEGEWMNGEKNGTGKYFYAENVWYEGNWNSNRKEGKGIFKSPQGQYDGLWLNDKKHGRGVLRMNNGTICQGQWQQDQFVSGETKYSNGDVYRGQTNERFQRHLQGQYVLGSKQETYRGTWRNNKKQGQGQITYNMNGEKYMGQMRNDQRQGNNCMYDWRNGTKVICSFKDNFPLKGKMVMPDDTSFEFELLQAKPKN